MQKRKIIQLISIIILVASIILTIVSYIMLPDIVITQIGNNPSHLSKPMAVLIPSILGIFCSALNIFKEFAERTQYKLLICSVLGLVVYGFTLIVNL